MTSKSADWKRENNAVDIDKPESNLKNINFSNNEKNPSPVKTENLSEVVELSNASLKFPAAIKRPVTRQAGYGIY